MRERLRSTRAARTGGGRGGSMSSGRARVMCCSVLAPLLSAAIAGCGSNIAGCGSKPEQAPARAPAKPKVAPSKRTLAPTNPSALQESTPAAVLEKMRGRLRVTPDARFIAALESVARIAGEKQPAAPVVRFGVGSWQVQIGSDVAGVVPELPGFADQYAMVLGRAKQQWKQLNPGAELAAPAPAPAEAPAAPDAAVAKDGKDDKAAKTAQP